MSSGAGRPIEVTIIAAVYIAMGAVGLVYHAGELNALHPFQNDTVWIECVRLLAVVAGVYLLRGREWARWLAVAWIGFHVAVSFLHNWLEVAVHLLFFAVIAYLLLRPRATRYFRPMLHSE